MSQHAESPQNFVPEPSIGPELAAVTSNQNQVSSAAGAAEAAPQAVTHTLANGEVKQATSVERAIEGGCTYLGGMATAQAAMLFKLEAKGQAARAAKLEAVNSSPDSTAPVKPKAEAAHTKTAETKPATAKRPDSAVPSQSEAPLRPVPAEKPPAETAQTSLRTGNLARETLRDEVRAPEQPILAEASQAESLVMASGKATSSETAPATLRSAAGPNESLVPVAKLFATVDIELNSASPPIIAAEVTPDQPHVTAALRGEYGADQTIGVSDADSMAPVLEFEAAPYLQQLETSVLLGSELGDGPDAEGATLDYAEDPTEGLFELEVARGQATQPARAELPLLVVSGIPAERLLTGETVASQPAALLEAALPPLLQEKLAFIIESADAEVIAKLEGMQELIVDSIRHMQELALGDPEPAQVVAIEQLLEGQCLALLRELRVEIDEQTFKRFIAQLQTSIQPDITVRVRQAGLDEGMHEHKQNFGSMAQDFSQAVTQKLSFMKLARFMVHGTLA